MSVNGGNRPEHTQDPSATTEDTDPRGVPEASVGETPMYGPAVDDRSPRPQTWDAAEYPAPAQQDAVAAPPDDPDFTDDPDDTDDIEQDAPIFQPATGWSLYWDAESVTTATLVLSTNALEPEIAVAILLGPEDIDGVLSALLELRADQYNANGQAPPIPTEWAAWLGLGIRGYPAETPPPRLVPSEFGDGDFTGEDAIYVDAAEYSVHWADDLWSPILTLTSSDEVNPRVACEVTVDSATLQKLLYALLELRYAQHCVTAQGQPITIPAEWTIDLGLNVPTAVAAPPAGGNGLGAKEKRKRRLLDPLGLESAMRSRTNRDTWLLRAAVAVLIGALVFVLLQQVFL